ncbi:glutamine amidotransferase [Heliorestis convoluta]|uniref:glutamine amidotransferase n=1 Tax=Heliorestis convoluta TaxID=356322 RepID=UPI00129B138B|nr:glutamine amidotransferase [Heliorestis convoluta]
MKKLFIIKTGSTFSSICDKHGDFEDFITAQLEIDSQEVEVIHACTAEVFPPVMNSMGIIITGSHAMVTDQEPWMVKLAQWLQETVSARVPVLGICFGHQLLAHAFGGLVDYHPKGIEIGTVSIELTEEGRKDSLLGFLPSSFQGHVTHAQTVLQLPPGATLLAKNDFEPHHAFVLHDRIWGVQFHPEFTAEITYHYVQKQKDKLGKAGMNIETIEESIHDTVYGAQLLKRFLTIASDC